jgi:threonine-phosphate decarboxylase
MAALRPSWTVSPFAQVLGQTFLAHIDSYRETLPALQKAVIHMGRELRRLACMDPDRGFEGPGFLCCGLSPRLSAAGVYEALLKRRIVVRNCDTIPGMPPGYIRVQARPEEDSARLLQELDTLFCPL